MPDARAVMESWFDALEARDLDRMLDLLADDVTMETEMLRTPITGKQMLRELVADAMDAYESIQIERRKIVSVGHDAAAVVSLHVRFRDDIDMWGEKLRTAGKELDVQAALFFEVNDAGKIARVMRVRDTLGVVNQLGLSPERVQELLRKFESRVKGPHSRAA